MKNTCSSLLTLETRHDGNQLILADYQPVLTFKG